MKIGKILIAIFAIFLVWQTETRAAQLNPMEDMMVNELLNMFGPGQGGNAHGQSSQWVCSWCGASATSANTPNQNGCRSGKKSHGWVNVGTTGKTTYVCNRCRAVVHTQFPPNSATCTGGGRNGYHQWIQR